MTLEALGWGPFFSNGFEPFAEHGYSAGRIALEHKNRYQIYSEHGELWGELAGRMLHNAAGRDDLPAVGDWVAIRPRVEEGQATIHGLLPRRSRFSRKAPGTATEEQIVAANVDVALLVTGLDGNYNPRRIERYLIQTWESGARPVVVLNKADLRDDLDDVVAEVESIALGVPVIPISAMEDTGFDALARFMEPGKTVVLLGSSGVGKSSITNRLAGADLQEVGDVSDMVGKGRHTTTRRELLLLPSGAIIIDTPGMRELGLWSGGEEGLGETFEDVEALAAACRFRDCTHRKEPGCAIREAIREGELDEGRFRNYLKMQRELAYLSRKQDEQEARAVKESWKRITMQMRHVDKRK